MRPSFFDELAKIKQAKIDPWWYPVGATAGLGGLGYLRHRSQEGGRSAPEQKTLAALQQPGLSREDQIGALKKHESAVENNERAGALLATTGGSLAGWGGKEILKKLNKDSDVGKSTSAEEAAKLYRAAFPKDNIPVEIDPSTGTMGVVRPNSSGVVFSPEWNRGQAQHTPKGGYAGKLGKDKERLGLRGRGIPEGVIDYGMQHGVTTMPGKANPMVAAHELGHAMFSEKPYAKVFRRAGMPLGVASMLGSSYMAAKGDPDSTSAKLAPAVAALGLVPMLGEEAYASIKGLQLMRKAGLPAEAIRHGALQGGRALGAYASKFGIPAVAAPYIIRKVRQYRMKQRENAGLETSQDLGSQLDALKSGK
jgi:hypothetical protein